MDYLVLVRPGEYDESKEGRLTERGEADVETLGRTLRRLLGSSRIDTMFHSSEPFAVQTADKLYDALGVKASHGAELLDACDAQNRTWFERVDQLIAPYDSIILVSTGNSISHYGRHVRDRIDITDKIPIVEAGKALYFDFRDQEMRRIPK